MLWGDHGDSYDAVMAAIHACANERKSWAMLHVVSSHPVILPGNAVIDVDSDLSKAKPAMIILLELPPPLGIIGGRITEVLDGPDGPMLSAQSTEFNQRSHCLVMGDHADIKASMGRHNEQILAAMAPIFADPHKDVPPRGQV
jgi:hypothetical protein